MDWSINLVGSKQGVRRKLQGAAPAVDVNQLPVVRAFINDAIDAMPLETTGVQVSARGHRDVQAYRLEIEIHPVDLELDTP